MSKYPVIKSFIDKHTKKKHKKGTKYEAKAERAKELQELGFIGEAPKPSKTKKKADKDESK